MSRIVAAYPLTPMQQGMLFHSLYTPGSDAYFIQVRARLEGALDREAFQTAWTRVVERHPVLRTAMSWQRREGARQVVWDRVPVPIRWFDWTDRSEIDRAQAWDALVEADRAAGIDLQRAPLLRVTLVRLAPEAYGFIWSLHHILLDGWSMARVLEEVLTDYDAAAARRPSPLTPPRPFQDFVAWVGRQSMGPAEAFWRTHLAGLEEPASLVEAAAVGHRRYVTHVVEVSEAVSEAVRRLAADVRVTVPAVLLGAWSLLVARETGRTDVIPGVTVSGRPDDLPGVEAMVGLFINTVPCRVVVDERQSVAAWLTDVQARLAGVQRFGHVGLTDMQQWTGRDRTTPLFDHLFVFENYPWRETQVAGLRVCDVESFEPTDYALSLVVQPGRALSLQATVDTTRLEPARVEGWLHRLSRLLETMAAGASTQPLWRCASLERRERDDLLVARNATTTPLDPRPVHVWFEAQVDRVPDAPAIDADDQVLTYAALDRRANQVAHWLRAQGVGPDVPVAIRIPRSVDMVVAVLGVLKTGGCCLPLDPEYPPARLDAMLQDAAPHVLLTTDALAASTGEPTTRVPVTVSPSNLFYLIYTSGSTGRPKGIGLPHAAMTNLVQWHAATLPSAPRLLQFASLSFDASFHELFAAWATGGTVVLITEDERRDPTALLTRVAEARVTRVIVPVVVLQQWAALHGHEPERFASLREIITTGEQLTITRPVTDLFAQLPGVTLHNHYGPAETHVVTSHTLSGIPASWPAHSPVGRPIANCDVYVLDRMGQPVPVGVTGELYLGGVQVARGYHAQPPMTAARFVPHPWATTPGARLYRTGDQARWLTDGTLEFLGRRDHLVKIRGFRVELGEVETVLGEHPAVAGCAVTAHEHAPGDVRLAAFLVLRREDVAMAELRAHVAARVPDYMIPAHWVVLPALPLTPNGKIDRRALPTPSATRPAGDARPSTDPVTGVLADLWADLLGVDVVGPGDDFFALGGHSLLAVQLIGRVRAALGVALPVRTLFEHSTLRAFSRAVQDSRTPAPRGPLTRRPDPLRAPLSAAQRRLVILERLQPGSGLYVVPGSVRLTGPLDRDALARALQRLVARHEPLRTRIDGDLESLTQVIEAHAMLPVVVHEGGPEALHPPVLDITRAPMACAELWVEGPDRHLLVVWMHHLVTDGSSNAVWLRDLRVLYAAEVTGTDPDLPALPLQYADVAWHEQATTQTEALRAGRDWWKDTLADLEPLALPIEGPSRQEAETVGATLVREVPTTVAAQVTRLARVWNVTAAMVHLAAWSLVLARETGQDECAIGVPVSLRDRPEDEDLVGLFVNTMVVRLAAPAHTTTVRDWVLDVRRRLLDAHAHRHVPFEQVVDAVAPPRDRHRHPLFQVLFDFHGWREPDGEAAGIRFTPVDVTLPLAKFDLTLTVDHAGAAPRALLEYATSRVTPALAARLLDAYDTVLTAMAAATAETRVYVLPPGPIEAISRAHALGQGGPLEAPTSILPELLHGLLVPGRRPALTDDHGVMSGAEMAAAVAALAEALRSRGVGPEVVVGVSADRQRAQIVALLAVLAAGGAFLPIDSDQPRARRAQLLLQAGVRLVLASGASVREADAGVHDIEVLDVAPLVAVTSTDREVGTGSWRADQLAYVLFTSGSTGTPKACQIEHGALSAYLTWARQLYGPEGQPVDWPLVTALTFDLTVTSLFLPLLTGGTLRLIESTLPLDAQLRVAFRDVDALKLTPSHATALATMTPEPSTNVHTVVVGGEALLPSHVATIAAWAPRARVINEYGPTEGTVGCVVAAVSLTDDAPPIGRPAPGVVVRVVDRHGREVAAGQAGELWVGGPQISRGYLGQPGDTARAFVAADDVRGRRWYRTGDRVRWRADGQLAFLGRRDAQLKIRGHRVEPAEVEAALLAVTSARRAVVRLVQDGGGPRLVAYLESASPIDETAVRRALADRLPAAWCPSAIVALAALPMTRHNKVDVAALPRPADRGRTGRAPAAGLEQDIADIWQQRLGVSTAGVDDNFFDVGGDSIVALQIVAALARVGIVIPPDALFTHPTIAALARVAQRGRISAPADSSVPAVVGPGTWTPAMAWFHEAPPPNPGHYVQALAVTLRDPLPQPHLERAVLRLVADHPALGRDAHRIVEGLDLSARGAEEAQQALDAHATRLQASLSLESGPLYRVSQVVMPKGAVLLLVAHHLVVDGVSWRIVLDELGEAMAALARGEEPTPRPEPVSLEAVAMRCRALADADDVRAELAHWRATVARPAGLWPDHDGPNRVADERSRTWHLDAPHLPQRGDVVEAWLLAAIALAVGDRQAGGVLVDIEGHGRRLDPPLDLSRTVGWLTAIWPLWLPRPDSGRAADALHLVQDALARTPAQGVGFGVLRYCASDPAVQTALRGTTPPVLFNFHGRVEAGAALSDRVFAIDEAPGPSRDPAMVRRHEVEISAAIDQAGLHVTWTWSPHRFDDTTVGRWWEVFDRTVRDLAGDGARDAHRPTPIGLIDAGLTLEDLADLEGDLRG